MTAKIPVAVVGSGFGARIQVPGFRLSGRFEVAALVGRDPERLRRAAARCGVDRTCTSLDEALVIPGLRAVSITTPPLAHADGAIAAAQAGLHVLCEKPMARTLSEAEAMVAAARGVVALVDHEFRFEPSRQLLARLIDDGALGTPQLVTAIANMPHFIDPWRPPPSWWFDAAAGGGWLGACGSHVIDALQVWLGDFASVAALVDANATTPAGVPVAGQADDTFTMLFRTRGGAQGVLQQSAASWGGRFEALRIAGSQATCWIDGDGTLWRADRDDAGSPVPVPDDLRLPDVPVEPWMGPFARRELPAFVRQAERFADLIDGRTLPPRQSPATFADGAACQAVIDAARASSRTGAWIALPARRV